MAAPNLTVRTIVELADDTGETPSKTLDETLTLTGFSDCTPGRKVALAATADDYPISLTGAIFLLIRSRDYPFSLRLAADETLIANLREFTLTCDDEDAAALTAAVLLTGNGSNVAHLDVWIVEKP